MNFPFRQRPAVAPVSRWATVRRMVLGLSLMVAATPVIGQTVESGAPTVHANFRLAARFAPYKVRSLVYSTSVSPRWIKGSEQFWYEWETPAGKTYQIVNPATGTKRVLFDNDRMAAELTRMTKDPWDGQHLPIRSIKFIDPTTLQFEVESSKDDTTKAAEVVRGEEQDQRQGTAARPKPKKVVLHFRYDVRTATLSEIPDFQAPDNHPSWASVSPDGQTIIFVRNHDLMMMNAGEYLKVLDARRGKSVAQADSADQKVETEEIRLTTDGEEYHSYGNEGRGSTDQERAKSASWRKPAGLSWSKDSKRFGMVRNDQRKVGDLWVIHSVGNKRPELETYKYDMPGEKEVTQRSLLVYDLSSRSMTTVDAGRFKDQQVGIFNDRQFIYPDSDEPRRSLWLADNSDEFYFWRRSRDQHKVDVVRANASTGEVRVLIEEGLNTYVEHRDLELLNSGDMLWWSERDGWAHLYRFGADGTLKGRLTEGPWHVDGITAVDQARGMVYFTANAREANEDPYFGHLYRVGIDGAGLTLLTPGNFDHSIAMGESARYAVASYSRVNTTPASALVDATTGRRIMDLETADLSRLMEAGYHFPEPYTVKAADGVTDLYGVMYKPFDFDSTRQYPIVAYVYPGPQTEAVAKSFSTAASEMALAQFGMVVVTVGNRGGHPDRSKWYHNYGYGDLRDYGLADKKTTIEQLAHRYPWVDLDRVGIYGHSGGGFMSTAAMLVYPDFFKVAVSSSGNHDNDVYNLNWSEKHHGIKEVTKGDSLSFEFAIERNSALARNLKGHLMLTTGDIDNNVHPAGTFRMADALIKANKRFDMFVFTGQRHGYGDMSDYWFWLRSEYFVRHLLGETRWNASIAELENERAQTGGR